MQLSEMHQLITELGAECNEIEYLVFHNTSKCQLNTEQPTKKKK